MKRTILVGVAMQALVAGGAAAQTYDPGANDDEIKVGVIVPLSGPASAYGSVGACFEGYFAQVNDNGGVNDRQVTVLVQDDGYNPARTLEQARRLVEREEVLLLSGNIGTPTNSGIHRYMNQRGVPHLFIMTGASKWDDPDGHPWTMLILPSYAAESQIYAAYIAENLPDARIGILYQNDDFGRDYRDALVAALPDSVEILADISYDVTAPTIDSQMSALKDSGADVFFNIASPKFAAQAVRRAGEIEWDATQFLVQVSNAKGAVLEPAGLEHAEGIISTQYLKDPSDPRFADDPDVRAWLDFQQNYFSKGSPANWWDWQCYGAASTLEHVLSLAGDDLTRENVMSIAANLDGFEAPMLLPGITVDTGPDDFAPIEAMSLVRFEGGEWRLFGDVIAVN